MAHAAYYSQLFAFCRAAFTSDCIAQ